MDIKKILKEVKRIELKTKGLSSQVFSGNYKTRFKGRGMSFSEVRNYQYGDDVRNIDWNVTARTNEPHVKVFEEERELTFMFLIDMSASSLFGSLNVNKLEFSIQLFATLAFSANVNNDKVGAIFFSGDVCENQAFIAIDDNAHRNSGDRTAYRYTCRLQSQRRSTDCCHR